MNIFYLSHDVIECAMMMCDAHVVKMILEYAQMMSTAHRVLDGTNVGYKATHKNHPCTLWVRESHGNYMWLFELFVATLNEYEYRYGRVHKTAELVSVLQIPPDNIRIKKFSEPPQAMPDRFKSFKSIVAYRCFYKYGKSHLHTWKNRPVPFFLDIKK